MEEQFYEVIIEITRQDGYVVCAKSIEEAKEKAQRMIADSGVVDTHVVEVINLSKEEV